jgi:hypothetical protein
MSKQRKTTSSYKEPRERLPQQELLEETCRLALFAAPAADLKKKRSFWRVQSYQEYEDFINQLKNDRDVARDYCESLISEIYSHALFNSARALNDSKKEEREKKCEDHDIASWATHLITGIKTENTVILNN